VSKLIVCPSTCHFGDCLVETEETVPKRTKLYAFAIADRAGPKVFEYTNDEEGLEELANLVRAEEVLAIIEGQRVEFELASTVSIGSVENRMPINRG